MRLHEFKISLSTRQKFCKSGRFNRFLLTLRAPYATHLRDKKWLLSKIFPAHCTRPCKALRSAAPRRCWRPERRPSLGAIAELPTRCATRPSQRSNSTSSIHVRCPDVPLAVTASVDQCTSERAVHGGPSVWFPLPPKWRCGVPSPEMLQEASHDAISRVRCAARKPSNDSKERCYRATRDPHVESIFSKVSMLGACRSD